MDTERGDTLFVPERRRSRRLQRRDPRLRCSRRRSAGEANETRREEGWILRHNRFVGSDEDGGSRRTSQRAERAIRQRAQRVEQSSTPDRGDEARPAGQIGMIAYADEATVPDEDLWSGLPLQISVLNAEKAGRS
jgi:hypothetical protein